MIRYSLIFILGLTAVLGQKQDALPDGRGSVRRDGSTVRRDRSTEPRASASGKKETTAIVIPAGALQVTPNVYKHTDAAGTTWIYRKTPFGIVKMKETIDADPEPSGNPFSDKKSASSKSSAAIVTAVEEGDNVRFERSTPFGPTRWSRKKSELSADEKEMLEQSRTRKSDKE